MLKRSVCLALATVAMVATASPAMAGGFRFGFSYSSGGGNYRCITTEVVHVVQPVVVTTASMVYTTAQQSVITPQPEQQQVVIPAPQPQQVVYYPQPVYTAGRSVSVSLGIGGGGGFYGGGFYGGGFGGGGWYGAPPWLGSCGSSFGNTPGYVRGSTWRLDKSPKWNYKMANKYRPRYFD